MSFHVKCRCSLAISVLGDGCRYCQPQEYIDRLHEQMADDEKEADELRGQLLEALKNLHKVIDSAGVMSLMNGVELGPVAWSIKANDAMEYANEAIAAAEEQSCK